ncbi:MAG: DUF362 domain-containing protein [Syntrophales bacterium]|nr:DUF362 domain-containing protein [Syntrophales bacterium]
MKVLVRKANYDYNSLREEVFQILDCLRTKSWKNKKVLIKPNLLLPSSPDQAICTHPMVVRAVCEYVIDCGAVPNVGDSPAMGSFQDILKNLKLDETLKNISVSCFPFTASTLVNCGPPFGHIELARDAIEADVVVNLPKLKTHSQMILTLAVKNLFGCVVGYRKVEWHLKAGVDRDLFALLLLSIAQKIAPEINLLDGIDALEGEGPGKRGQPRHLGVIIGSDNAIAVDVAVSRMLCIPVHHVPVLRVAEKLGLLKEDLHVEGNLPTIRDFKLPSVEPTLKGPVFLKNALRNLLLDRPQPDQKKCNFCGECSRICPAQAIAMTEEQVTIIYDKCIRCYCCIEVCPMAAMAKIESLPSRITKRFINSC